MRTLIKHDLRYEITTAKKGFAIAGDEQVESSLLSIIFVRWDSFVILNPQHQKPAKRYSQC